MVPHTKFFFLWYMVLVYRKKGAIIKVGGCFVQKGKVRKIKGYGIEWSS